MKIHITGASCAGSTTLGLALAQQLGYSYFDTDNYFWQDTPIPFSVRRDPADRNTMLLNDLNQSQNAIVGGSLIDWGTAWREQFDLVVFLYIPREIRMERLKAREVERYGNRIFTDGERAAAYAKYLAWANGYDDNTITGRNLKAQTNWLAELSCHTLEITGDTSLAHRLEQVSLKIKGISMYANP